MRASIKNKLVLTTAMVAVSSFVGGYSRRAYADCIGDIAENAFVCSGPTTTEQNIVIMAPYGMVKTDATFSIETTGDAITLSNSGGPPTLYFVDNYASLIKSTGGSAIVLNNGNASLMLTGDVWGEHSAVAVTATGGGIVGISSHGQLYSNTNSAIFITTENSDVVLELLGDVTSSQGGGVIVATDNGMVDIDLSGNISALNDSGILVFQNTAYGGDVYIKTATGSKIEARTHGVNVLSYSEVANITLDVAGDVTLASGPVVVGVGATLMNASATGDINVITNGKVMVQGGYGVSGVNRGSGDVSLIVNGDVTTYSPGGNAVWGRTAGGVLNITTYGHITAAANSAIVGEVTGGSGDMTVDVHGDISSAGSGIVLENLGTGKISLQMSGGLAATNQGIGIHGYGDIYVDISSVVLGGSGSKIVGNGVGDIDVTVGATGHVYGLVTTGVDINQQGQGAVKVEIDGDVQGVASALVVNSGVAGSGVDIRINNGAHVSSQDSAIKAYDTSNVASSVLQVEISGDVVTAGMATAIMLGAYNVGGAELVINKSGRVYSGGSQGVEIKNYGAGGLTVDVDGIVYGGGGSGLHLENNAGDFDMVIGSNADIVSMTHSGVVMRNNVGSAGGSLVVAGKVSGQSGINVQNDGTDVINVDIRDTAKITGVQVGMALQAGSGDIDAVISGDVSGGVAGLGVFGSGTGKSDVRLTKTANVHSATGGGFALQGSGTGTLVATIDAGAQVYGGANTGMALLGQNVTVNTEGDITAATGMPAVVFQLAGSADLNISGGRIAGDVIDMMPSDGFSTVNITGAFTSEGDFDVSSFNVVKAGVFTAGAGTTIKAASNDVYVAGTLRAANAGAAIDGAVRVAGGLLDVLQDFNVSGGLSNSGTVSIAQGKTLTVDTMAPVGVGGVLTFGLGSVSDHGLLVVSGGAADITKQTVTVNVASGASLNDGDQILIIDGNGTAVGGPGTGGVDVTSNSLLWNFKMVDGTGISDDSDIYLTLAKAAPPKPVDSIIAMTTLTFADASMNMTSERLSLLRRHRGSAGVSAGDYTSDKDTRVWAQGLGQRVHQGERKGAAGYGAHLLGGTFGADTDRFLDNGVLGLAFSYGESKINARNVTSTHTNIDSYQLTFYGDYNWDNGVYFDGMGAYAFNKNDTIRYGAGGAGLDARASFDSYNVGLRGEMGRVFSMGAAFVTPFVTANWVYYDVDSYSETGGGAGNLNVESKGFNQVDLGLGTKAGMMMATDDGGLVMPEISLAYRRDMLNNSISTTQTYVIGGQSYAVDGPEQARDKLTLGGQVKYFGRNGFEVSAAYNFDIKQDYTAHTGYVRAGVRF